MFHLPVRRACYLENIIQWHERCTVTFCLSNNTVARPQGIVTIWLCQFCISYINCKLALITAGYSCIGDFMGALHRYTVKLKPVEGCCGRIAWLSKPAGIFCNNFSRTGMTKIGRAH